MEREQHFFIFRLEQLGIIFKTVGVGVVPPHPTLLEGK